MDKSTDLAGRLHSAALRLLRGLRKTDAESGVGPARLSALSVLVYAGPQSLSELARIEQVSPPTMSRVVRGLEDQGLADRRESPSDRRSTTLRATRKGRRVLERARLARIELLSKDLEHLSASERRTLDEAARILTRLRTSSE